MPERASPGGGLFVFVKLWIMEKNEEINYVLVEKVCHAFGKTIEEVGTDGVLKYPMLLYPESLLPYPKPVIRYAFDLWKKYAEEKGNREQLDMLKFVEAHLDSFIADDEAMKENLKLASQEAFLEIGFRKKS